MSRVMRATLNSLNNIVKNLGDEYLSLIQDLQALHVPHDNVIYKRIDRLRCIKEFVVEASILLNEEFKDGGLYMPQTKGRAGRNRVTKAISHDEVDAQMAGILSKRSEER